MYIFSRSTVAALGRELEAIPAAVGVAEHVTSVTGRDLSVFRARFGAPQGAIMWSTRVDSFADVVAMTDMLMADAKYLEIVASMNGLFMAPAEDRLGRFITTPLEAATSRFYGITRAAMANGRQAEAIAFGAKTADYIGSSLGVPSAFTKASYGGFGDVSWITGFDSQTDVDAFDDWQMTDSGYHAIVEEAGNGMFVENSGHTSLIEKLN